MKDNNLFSIAQQLEQHELYAFETGTFQALFQLGPRRATYLLNRLEEHNLIARIERGKYLFFGFRSERVLSNPMFIGCQLATPSYISFWTALHHYGFTDQVSQTISVATTQKRRDISFQHQQYRFTTLQPAHFFGYRREVLADLPVVIADTSKLFIDCLLHQKPAGGLVHTAQALFTAVEESQVDKEEITNYTCRIGNKSLNSRLGFLMQSAGQGLLPIEPSKGPVLLDPTRPRGGKYNAYWQIYINVPEQDLFHKGIL